MRSQAGGFHYTSTGELPLIPGIDAVVRDPAGKLRYAILDDTTRGTMAERTVIELDRSVVLPDTIDPVVVAAAMNPAMSSWVALRQRIDFGGRQQVAILGATGNAGRMAIQVAKRFGASQVIAAGRDTAKLDELTALGADEVCTFDQLARAADVDVVIDYVWGEPTAAAMVEILTNRADRGRPLTWLEIGAIAGPEAAIPAAALRAARLQIVGSGIGSVSGRDFVKELPKLAEAVAARRVRRPRQGRAARGGRAGVDQRPRGRATGSCSSPDRDTAPGPVRFIPDRRDLVPEPLMGRVEVLANVPGLRDRYHPESLAASSAQFVCML